MSSKKEIQQFLNTEHNVYDGFGQKAAKAQQQGLLPDPVLQNRLGGITVAARHPRLSAQLATLAQSLRQLVPCFAYNEKTAHSTFCYWTSANFRYDADHHQTILSELYQVVGGCLANISIAQRNELSVNYRSPLYNRTTVILPGVSRSAYVDLLLTLANACAGITGISMKPSWGVHITAARFLCQVDASAARQFFDFIGRAPALDQCPLDEVNIACVEADPTGIKHTVFKQFILGSNGFDLVV